jgi:YD repeat-containing protein
VAPVWFTFSIKRCDFLGSAKTGASGTTTYGYDNLASMASSNANGASVAYTWDQLNRLGTVTDNRLPTGQNTTYYSYDAASNLAAMTYPNRVQSTFTYDDLNGLRGWMRRGAATHTHLGQRGIETARPSRAGGR